MIKKIGHLAFVAEDMERSLHFYCDILGFKKAFELHKDNGDPWIVYIKVCDGQFIELFYSDDNKSKSAGGPVGYNHFCLEVDNIHHIADHLKHHGLTLDVEPTQGKDSNFQCWIKDPDGNRIEFMQMNPESPQAKS